MYVDYRPDGGIVNDPVPRLAEDWLLAGPADSDAAVG
jgi:hypothetical protein